MELKDRYSFEDLLKIMEMLLAPDGCPWDREQTHQSLRTNCVEEAYEVVDAIDSGNRELLVEELGDLLLQPLFHALIAERSGEFGLDEVLTQLSQKLITRHAHIFGENKAASGSEALQRWEQEKNRQKKYSSVRQKMESVPKVFPSLLRAQKLIKYSSEGECRLDAAFNEYRDCPSEQNLGALMVELVRHGSKNGNSCEIALNSALARLIEQNREQE